MADIAFRNLFSSVQKLFLSTSAAFYSSSASVSRPFAVEYLMNSCGLPLKSAISAANKILLNEKKLKKPDSVLDFLKSRGFSSTQIAKLIEKRPALLHCNVEGNLKPKVDFLVQNGFKDTLLPQLIVANPTILLRALDSHIKPSVEFLKEVINNEEKFIAAIGRSSWLITFDLKGLGKPNVEYLIREGMPISNIGKLIVFQPSSMLQKPDRMMYAVEYVKKLGFEPSTPMFVHGLRAMLSMSETTWKKKFEVLKSLGWSEEQIVSAFKRNPFSLACSEEKLRLATDFYLNTMKLDLDTLISYPTFLMFDIDQRLRPRYNVIKVLQSKNLLEGKKKIVWLFTMSEKDFRDKYVLKHVDEVPELLQIYDVTAKKKRTPT
ncbi:transcription termination factor MTERF8, chloroplastic-like isoform X2 [Tripterygium wilfordii]|uniref:transcription termination factor MTERF8, chloroplastic-like isoform X2 n=1 Tax=Tripterygium wilfordii TaxID=458696 RepID=UPI0018F82719|nr:transcription termination factor MTERF8, chloroplastic-like isoform X2 [Tripterygium wilfordii]XP_038680305.1 transcription termination factor MTERF8, chloroplastic-like isoform X2 [Tripterygium wilfordii]XP_038680306.1 transcription termination factor MTERF8, chloroplastic-like isoform X2 [Tripterygium wilfordii]XP_038680307.1 transcription termination factor MTERF8, chloroplastic-like isoform X2 [Tripterygium wilfordii]